jgi:hypothetical protein
MWMPWLFSKTFNKRWVLIVVFLYVRLSYHSLLISQCLTSRTDEFIIPRNIYEAKNIGPTDAALVHHLALTSVRISLLILPRLVMDLQAPEPLLPNYGAGNIRRMISILVSQ